MPSCSLERLIFSSVATRLKAGLMGKPILCTGGWSQKVSPAVLLQTEFNLTMTFDSVCLTRSYLQQTGDMLFFQTLFHQGLLHVPAWSCGSSSKTSSFSPVQLLLLTGHSAVAGCLWLSKNTENTWSCCWKQYSGFFRVYKVLNSRKSEKPPPKNTDKVCGCNTHNYHYSHY